jgi:hypothetical protein
MDICSTQLDWGTVPAWVGAVLTGSSLLIASLSYRRSVEERREERLSQERAQAVKVSAWFDRESRQVFLQNASDAAVNVRVFFEKQLINGRLSVTSSEVTLGPDQRISSYELPSWLLSSIQQPPRSALVIIDAAGVVWLRNSDGKLDRLDERDRSRLNQNLEPSVYRLDWQMQ